MNKHYFIHQVYLTVVKMFLHNTIYKQTNRPIVIMDAFDNITTSNKSKCHRQRRQTLKKKENF